MIKANITLLLIVSLIYPLLSQENDKVFAHFTDSNGLEVHVKLREFNSVYQISKTFNISIEQILKYNKIKDAESIQSDQTLKILLDKDQIKNVNSKRSIAIYYKVKQGETLFRIARTYLNQDLDEFQDRNNLSSAHLKKDEIVILGYYPVQIPEVEIKKEEVSDSQDKDNSSTKVSVDESKSEEVLPEVVYIKQRGIAFVHGKGSSRDKGMYVLHPAAKLNSEIELYNPMRNRTVKAKVVGRIPEGTYNSDINVVLSSSTARSLGALDSRFRVDIKYIQ